MSLVNIEALVKEAHVKLDRAEQHYLALDKKLDRILKAKVASKLTPIYSFLLLALVFWLGTRF